MEETRGTFEPGEALPLATLKANPLVGVLAAHGWTTEEAWMGAGRLTPLGLKTRCPGCFITWSMTVRGELVLVNFERHDGRRGLRSPLQDMHDFLRLASIYSGGRMGVAKIKQVGRVEGGLTLERLTEAYRRMFHFVELGRDARGFRWIGRTAEDFLQELKTTGKYRED